MMTFSEPEPPVTTLLGEKPAVAPGGSPPTDIVTFPEKPLSGEMLTAYVALAPALSDCDVGLIEPTKSPAEVFTKSGIVVLLESLPLAPVIVKVYAPGGVVDVVFISKDAVPAPPNIFAGVIRAVAPAGSPLTLSATVPVKPFNDTILAW